MPAACSMSVAASSRRGVERVVVLGRERAPNASRPWLGAALLHRIAVAAPTAPGQLICSARVHGRRTHPHNVLRYGEGERDDALPIAGASLPGVALSGMFDYEYIH